MHPSSPARNTRLIASTTTCAGCRFFRPDASNPTAAMGRCYHDARHGYFFANERHRCVDHSSEPRAAPND